MRAGDGARFLHCGRDDGKKTIGMTETSQMSWRVVRCSAVQRSS